MQKKIAISQSNYIPWRGYFDLINYVDVFVFFDETQFTRRDWRNRNKIICNNDIKWLTIPLQNKGNYFESILNMRVKDNKWIGDHLNKIKSYYAHSKNFKKNFEIIKKIYDKINSDKLSNINQGIIKEICKVLEINTKFYNSTEFVSKKIIKNPSVRLLDICEKNLANTYVSGSAAQNYLDKNIFSEKNIKIEWFDYKVEKSSDKNNLLDSNLSIVDNIMNFGLNKSKFLKYS